MNIVIHSTVDKSYGSDEFSTDQMPTEFTSHRDTPMVNPFRQSITSYTEIRTKSLKVSSLMIQKL